jgi:DNA-binding FadR family transcriptional regulator
MIGQHPPIVITNTAVAPRRLHEQVLESLVERIVSGEFAAGDSLPSEADLCEVYAVSRSSVREALRVLAEKGLIEVRHGLGTRVNPAENWDFMDAVVLCARRKNGAMAPFFNDLHEARAILECEAAALAAQRSDANDHASMHAALERMKDAFADPVAFGEADFAFHRAIFEGTRNRVLLRMAGPIRELLEYTIQVVSPVPGSLQRAYEEHLAIYYAIRSGDRSAARDAMRAHLDRARASFANRA